MEKLRGSLQIEYTLARHGAQKLRTFLRDKTYIAALGTYNGQQAVQQAKAGIEVIYVSGWQVAACANQHVYPDQSLYPVDTLSRVVKQINNALRRADQIQVLENSSTPIDYYLPIIADGEAGFGGILNVYEFMLSMIEAGAAGVHFEDQLSSEKKCGHLGGKVLIPVSQMISVLKAARLASQVANVPTVLIARTDAFSASFMTNEFDPFVILDQRTTEGYYHFQSGLEASISRGLAYAPFVDMLWFETSEPDLDIARQFATAIHQQFPNLPLMYNCSPSFNWRKHLSPTECQSFQKTLSTFGYKFVFVTLAAFHATNFAMFQLSKQYLERGMAAYSELQQQEFEALQDGYTAVRHQSEVGVQYFDTIASLVGSSTLALPDSTETEQF